MTLNEPAARAHKRSRPIFGSDFHQCEVCKRLRKMGRNKFQGWTCDAFPVEIPILITRCKHDHREEYPGDNGIRFEVVDGVPDPWEEQDRLDAEDRRGRHGGQGHGRPQRDNPA